MALMLAVDRAAVTPNGIGHGVTLQALALVVAIKRTAVAPDVISYSASEQW